MPSQDPEIIHPGFNCEHLIFHPSACSPAIGGESGFILLTFYLPAVYPPEADKPAEGRQAGRLFT